MSLKSIKCFKEYDVRGEIGKDFDELTAYRIGRAIAQHLKAKKMVLGHDIRESSPRFADATSKGIRDSGSDVLTIGLAGTEEMYSAVTDFGACGGVEITASHNPINFNGIKMVKHKSLPLDSVEDYEKVKLIANEESWIRSKKIGIEKNISIEARKKYLKKVASFIDASKLKNLKVVVNCGNGTAGPTFDALEKYLLNQRVEISFIHLLKEPNPNFPFGIPNPLIPENRSFTSNMVRKHKANLGIAFDGDFDRCFFFDEKGRFMPGDFIVGIFAHFFLLKNKGSKIVHDPRLVWNIRDVVAENGGEAVQARTGHAFFKKAMRKYNAVYGGEISAHHYFREFSYCDSGIIPSLLMLEILSKNRRSLGQLFDQRMKMFRSSEEINFREDNPTRAIKRVLNYFKGSGKIEEIDGLSISFIDWRFNLRASNTEPLLRLNVETKGSVQFLRQKISLVAEVIQGLT